MTTVALRSEISRTVLIVEDRVAVPAAGGGPALGDVGGAVAWRACASALVARVDA